jgi:predicted TIM-barrel fold metal-dependent hydrolase
MNCTPVTMTAEHPPTVTRRQALRTAVALGCATLALAPARGVTTSGAEITHLIDFHTHLTHGLAAQELGAITAPDLLHWMDAHDIGQAVVLPLVSPEAFWYPITSEHVLTATAPHRDRLIPFCAIDPRTLGTHLPTHQEVVDLLKRYIDAGAKGVGEHKPQLAIDDPLSMRLYEACAEVRLPVLFHLDNFANMDLPGLPGLARVLTEFPDLVMIAHGKGWWASIAGGVRQADLQVGFPRGPVAPGGAVDALLTAHKNLYADLSSSGAHALLRDKEFGAKFLERWSDRLLFGTDYYLKSPVDFDQFTLFDALQASEETRRKVGRENARRVLRLTEASNL